MNGNFPRFPHNTLITCKQVLLVFIIIICGCENIFSQNLVETTTVKETFQNNNRGWTLGNKNSTSTSIDGNRYIIDLNSSSTWKNRINIPNDIKNCLFNEDAKVSFDLQMLDRNGAMTSGIGLVFDQIGEDYNVIYLGEEGGKIFSSIIPRRNNEFREPIKDGRSVKFQSNITYRITIDRKFNNYRVFINSSLILSFTHKEVIQFTSFYFTTGKYAISDLVATKSTFVREGNDIGEEKNFDPSKHKTFILLAGVSKYPSTDFSPLNSPILDITSMRNFWLSTSGGSIPVQNIDFFSDREATVRNVVSSARRIANKATPNDVIIIYLTGHGYWGGYYCCYDALLPYEVLNDIIKGSRAKHKLVIVDACFSGCIKNIVTPPAKGTVSDES